MTTFFDTNALVYLANEDETLHAWSKAVLIERKNHGPVIVADTVFSEFSVSMDTIEDVQAVISKYAFERYPNDDEMLFRAGKAFKHYRDVNKGMKVNVLPDFMIGAAAELAGVPLVTNDLKNFKTYFPDLKLIQPAPAPPAPAGSP